MLLPLTEMLLLIDPQCSARAGLGWGGDSTAALQPNTDLQLNAVGGFREEGFVKDPLIN